MTNLEKYKDEIINYSRDFFCDNFVEPIILKQFKKKCRGIGCDQCRLLQQIWFQEEYQEPETDWSKVAVDTPIYVREDETDEWLPRYFAKYENGMVFTWDDGMTSFSAEHDDWYTDWACAKLAEVEE